MAAFGTLPATMRDLGVTVPAMEAVDETAGESGRFLAGFVAQRIFDANFIDQCTYRYPWIKP